MPRVLVTGANGFLGKAVSHGLAEAGYIVRRAIRNNFDQIDDKDIEINTKNSKVNINDEVAIVGNIDPDTDWSDALEGVDVIVHLAARVHIMKEEISDPLHEFRQVNTLGSKNLAQSAAGSQVNRLVYVSTVKVNGEHTDDAPFVETNIPNPQDPYAVSKWEAEQALMDIAKQTGLEVVIIRPPLVYGPGVKGNLLRLIRWIDMGIPLPFRNVDNRRSFIGVDNLVDFITKCSLHPQAAGEIFLISDENDLSTTELIKKLAYSLNKPVYLFPIPINIIRTFSKIIRKRGPIDRLFGSLQIKSEKARCLLNWTPPFSVDEGMSRTVSWYRSQQSKT